METSFVSMKMVVLVLTLIIALVSPTLSSTNYRKVVRDTESAVVPVNSFFGCPKLMNQNMTERVIKHTHASLRIKELLRGSAKFVECVAAKSCVCSKLRFPPLIYGCFAAIGGYCMTKALRGQNIPCALHCTNQITANNTQLLLDDMSITNFCFSKCVTKNLH